MLHTLDTTTREAAPCRAVALSLVPDQVLVYLFALYTPPSVTRTASSIFLLLSLYPARS